MTSSKIVAVTGSTGFVGRYVVRELLAQGYSVRALARSEAAAKRHLPRDAKVELVLGDALNAGVLDAAGTWTVPPQAVGTATWLNG